MNLFNPILSKAFIYSGLKYNETGLYYLNKSENNQEYIFITNDTNKIVSLLGLDPIEIEGLSELDFFEKLVNCEYIKLDKFFTFKDSNSPCKDLQKFSMYLHENNVEPRKTYTKVKFEDYSDINPEFNMLLGESNRYLNYECVVNDKFNGKLIKLHYPDYDMTRLSETIPMFKNSFETIRDFKLYVIEHDMIEIMKEFYKITNKE